MSDQHPFHRRLKKPLEIGRSEEYPRYVRLALAAVPKGAKGPEGSWHIDDNDMEEYQPSELNRNIKFFHKMSAGSETSVLGRIGFCIYCGAPTYRPGSAEPCTSEHVIPQGLGGKLILEQASCHKCAISINTFEGNLLRTLFNVPRRSMSIRGRRRAKIPVSISTIYNGEEIEVELPIDMHPSILMMPSLYLPHMMTSLPFASHGVQKFWSFKLNSKGFSGGSGLQNYMTPILDLLKFGQLLAKIAHCYSMSFHSIPCMSLDKEPLVNGRNSPLPSFIRTVFNRDEYPMSFYDFVGGFSERVIPSSQLHELGHGHILSGEYVFDVVYIWLFANLGAPIYIVVTDYSKADKQLLNRLSSKANP